MEYRVKVRRGGFFWKSIKVIGHKVYASENRMDFFLKDGSIISYGNWDKCDLILGKDWVIATRDAMERESGLPVKINV